MSILLPLSNVRHLQGKLVGKMETLGFKLRNEAVLETLTTEVIKTSEIEGQILDLDQVRSSIAQKVRNRGVRTGTLRQKCRWSSGDDVRRNPEL